MRHKNSHRLQCTCTDCTCCIVCNPLSIHQNQYMNIIIMHGNTFVHVQANCSTAIWNFFVVKIFFCSQTKFSPTKKFLTREY